jgi:hypothetical protein
MKSAFVSLIFLILGGIGYFGCSHKAVEEKLNEKMSVQPAVSGTPALQADAVFLIENSQLTSLQKEKLTRLQEVSGKQLESYRDQSLRLRAILIQDVLSAHYNRSEVKLIQSKIKKVEYKRVALIFRTIDIANGIMGRDTNAEENAQLLNRMMLGHESQ